MIKDIKHTLKHSAIYSLGGLITKLVGLILIPIYTDSQYLTVAAYGIYGVMEITNQIISAFLGLGLSSGLNRWYWDKAYKDKQKSLFYSSLLGLVVSGLIIAFCLSFIAKDLSLLVLKDVKYAYLFKLVIWSAFFQNLFGMVSTLIRLQTKSVLFSTVNVLRLVLSLGVTILFVVYYGKGVEGIFEAQLISFGLTIIFLIPYILKNIELKLDMAVIKDMLVYCYPLVFASLSAAMLSAVDRYCLNYMSTYENVAVYSLGYRISNTIKVFITSSIWMALWPMLMKKMDSPDCKRFYSKVMTYIAVGVMVVVLMLVLYSPEILGLITVEDKYLLSIKIIPIISLAIYFGSLKDISMIGLYIKKKTGIIGRILVFITILNLGLNLLLIPIWDYVGAALSTLLCQFIFFIIVYNYAQKQFKVPYEVLKIFYCIAIGTGLYFASTITSDWNIVLSLLYKTGLLISFPFILYVFGFYEEVEKEYIAKMYGKLKSFLKRG